MTATPSVPSAATVSAEGRYPARRTIRAGSTFALPLRRGFDDKMKGFNESCGVPPPYPEGRAKTPSADTADRSGPSVAAEGVKRHEHSSMQPGGPPVYLMHSKTVNSQMAHRVRAMTWRDHKNAEPSTGHCSISATLRARRGDERETRFSGTTGHSRTWFWHWDW